jgi:hypothetical protein
VIALALGLAAREARAADRPLGAAQQVDAERTAAAEALFDQGKRLMGVSKFAEACPKFAESERLDHGVGTLLNLADCYQQNGQIASAWAEFRGAVAAASAAGQPEREDIARERERLLEPRVARLTIVVRGEAAVPGLVVKRDDVVLDGSLWNVAMPVDPGDHVLAISAPGKLRYARLVRVPKTDGARVSAEVPPLEDAPSFAPSAPARRAFPEARTVVSLAIGGLGAAGVIAGSALGAHAITRNGDSAAHCREDRCDAAGVAIRDDALHYGTASTIAFAVAGAALATGATLYFTNPTSSRMAACANLSVTPSSRFLLIGATW